MRKKGIALLAALLLALLAGCGANGAAQPEQIDEPAVDPNLSPTAAFMAALQEDEVDKGCPLRRPAGRRKPGADVEGAE